MKLTTTRPEEEKDTTPSSDGGKWEKYPVGSRVSARVADIELDEWSFTDKKTNELKNVQQIKWTFTIMDKGTWQGKDVFGKTTTNFVAHPNCKAYSWASAITQREPAEGESLDTDQLIGLPCVIEIGHSKPDKEGRTWMRVDKVYPASMAQHVQPASFAPPAASFTAPDDAPF